MLRIKNLEDRATTPIAPEVIVQTRTGTAWDKPVSQIHPAAFVLNRKEQRDIFKVLHTDADLVRATLMIKEQENGHVLMTTADRKIGAEGLLVTLHRRVLSSADPATPPPPDK